MGERTLAEHDQYRAWVEPLLERAAAYALSIVGNREDAEDAVQEAAVKAYRSLDRYDRSQSFRGWWFAIVRNCCLDLMRKRRARPETATVDLADTALSGSDEWEVVARRNDLRSALSQLSPVHRLMIELRYFGDCSYADIATALGIPVGTVMSRLHAAREALAKTYRRETNEAG